MARQYVVTGAASGIGRATVALLLRHGHHVIGVDLRDSDVIADLATAEGRIKMLAEVTALTGGVVDAVAACAGISLRDSITMSVNFFGAVTTLEGLRPLLEKGTEPRAVAITSYAALMGVDQDLIDAALAGDEPRARAIGHDKGIANYTSSKAALAQWCRRAAPMPEWAGSRILLNMVAPGIVDTPMVAYRLRDPVALAKFREELPLPLGRYAQPEEIAALLDFLLSPANSYLSGQNIYADGGSEALFRGAKLF